MEYQVTSEYGVLTDVLLSKPAFYEWFPSCQVAANNMAAGKKLSLDAACKQHDGLVIALESAGVRCHFLAPCREYPDLTFTRDFAATTPWGVTLLKLSAHHRKAETSYVAAELHKMGIPIAKKIAQGTLEGGDVCVFKPGLAIVGFSGDRSTQAGACDFSGIFQENGWDVIEHMFHPQWLHLDTMLGTVDECLAVACTDILSEEFIQQLSHRDIRLLPVTIDEMRALACNIVALGDRRILAASHNTRINKALRDLKYHVIEVEIDQFTQGGGGIHCLTMPLRREATK